VRHFIFLPATTRASDFDATVRTLIEDVMPQVRSRAAW